MRYTHMQVYLYALSSSFIFAQYLYVKNEELGVTRADTMCINIIVSLPSSL